MYSFLFKSKLQRLNPGLYVNEEARSHIFGEFYASSLCLNKYNRHAAMLESEYAQLDTASRKYLEDYDSGKLPQFVCGVPLGWIPEHDQFAVEKDSVRFVARGWRSTLMILAKQTLISLDKARKVFGCPGLGLDTYDRLDRLQKEDWAKETVNAQ